MGTPMPYRKAHPENQRDNSSWLVLGGALAGLAVRLLW